MYSVLLYQCCSAGAADVLQAVQFAAAHNLTVAVKGGAWSAVNVVYNMQCSVVTAGLLAIVFLELQQPNCGIACCRGIYGEQTKG